MKITVNQLRKIIREEVEKTLIESPRLVGGADRRMSGGRVEDELKSKSKKDPLITALQNDINFIKSQIKKAQSGKLKGQDIPFMQKTLDDLEQQKLEKLTKVRESVSRPGSSPLKDGGVVNRDSGEILNMNSVPQKYLPHTEVDEMGYTTLPNEQFEKLRGELESLSAGKPKKQRKAPFQLNKEAPDPQDVHDAFSDLKREECGACDGRGKAWDETCVTCGGTGSIYIDEKEVSLEDLAHELGVDPKNIDWNGTGLRVINGVVTELIGDTPYRTNR